MSQMEMFETRDVYNPAFENPMVVACGIGPQLTKCKSCTHLNSKQYSKTYYKCELRGNTNGPGTDHRVNFQACAKYEEASR